jgi:hypothetical protein
MMPRGSTLVMLTDVRVPRWGDTRVSSELGSVGDDERARCKGADGT